MIQIHALNPIIENNSHTDFNIIHTQYNEDC